MKCLKILECYDKKICIIVIFSNYTKCVFLKWNKVYTYLKSLLHCVRMYYIYPGRVTSIQAEILSLQKWIKEKLILCTPTLYNVIYIYSILNGSSIYTYRVGFKYWPCWIHCYNPSEQRVFLSGCTSFLSFIFLIENGCVLKLAQL